jgi:hypothetical protein
MSKDNLSNESEEEFLEEADLEQMRKTHLFR